MPRRIAPLLSFALLFAGVTQVPAQSDRTQFTQWWNRDCPQAFGGKCNNCPAVDLDVRIRECIQALVRDSWSPKWILVSDNMDARWSSRIWIKGDAVLLCVSGSGRSRGGYMTCESMSMHSAPPLGQNHQPQFAQ